MRMISVVIALLALGACSKKDKDSAGGGGGSAASGSAAAVVGSAATPPVTCPPGNALKDNACVPVVTAEKVAVVVQQQSRIDELAKLLDQTDTVGAAIEMVNNFRQLELWKTTVAKNEQLKLVDGAVGSLDVAVKKLRELRGNLGEASARLGNLKGELDRMLQDTGAARRIEEVRAQVSGQLRTALQPLAAQVADTIQNALGPLVTRMQEASMVVGSVCLLSRGNDKVKDMCTKATALFDAARKYLDDLKGRPAALYDEVATKLETAFEALVDEQSKKVIDAAQVTVQEALRLPPAPPAGSAAGSAGSAAGSAAAGSAAAATP